MKLWVLQIKGSNCSQTKLNELCTNLFVLNVECPGRILGKINQEENQYLTNKIKISEIFCIQCYYIAHNQTNLITYLPGGVVLCQQNVTTIC